MTMVWLPAEALQGPLRGAIGDLPPAVELAAFPADGSVSQSNEVEVVVPTVALSPRLAELLPQLTRLRVVQTLSAGVDWLPLLPPQVTLHNAAGVHDGPVAEWILAVLLADAKRLPYYLDRQREAAWDEAGNLSRRAADAREQIRPAGDLAEMTVLIVGAGSIGMALAARLRPCGTQVLAVARRARPAKAPLDLEIQALDALPDLVSRADAVVLLAPLTEQTRGMVDADFLAATRPGALLVNAGRGGLVDTEALVKALHEGRVRAALDVTAPEPLPPDHPLWHAPDVIITPHVAGSTPYWLPRAYRLVGDQLRRYAAGVRLLNARTEGY